jgi:hypothetical protein
LNSPPSKVLIDLKYSFISITFEKHMSMEEMNNGPRPEDVEAAKALMQEDPLLSRDPYTQRVVETGTADNGEVIDIGNFLSARSAVLKKWKAEAQLAAAERKDHKSYDAAVVNAERPDLEIEE